MRMPNLAEDRRMKSFTLNLAHLNESSLKWAVVDNVKIEDGLRK